MEQHQIDFLAAEPEKPKYVILKHIRPVLDVLLQKQQPDDHHCVPLFRSSSIPRPPGAKK